jgi:glycine/D-amino acid oxidase-like deaminating enzyme
MTQKILIVGGGIIGASVAWNLAKSGADVTVVDAGVAGATPASFGWINASFFLSDDHFRLRCEGIAAYHRMAGVLDLPVDWCGCLCWDGGADAFAHRQDTLSTLGYQVEEVDQARFKAMEPHVADPPERCHLFPGEAAGEPYALASTLLTAAQSHGARVIRGVAVDKVLAQDGVVKGISSKAGDLYADQVLIAAGVASSRLLSELHVALPMLHRPALVIKTRPVPPVLQHILVSDVGEVRQLPDGSIMLPASVGHQQDASDTLPVDLEAAALAALKRLQVFLPDVPLSLAEVIQAERPMPEDGLPAVGSVGPGGYVAVMHSGITLAAIMGELISTELLQGESNFTRSWLSPYRPQRFRLDRAG